MKRVLQVVSSLNIGSGIANFIMSYYRHIDRNKVQFDFLLFNKMPNSFDEEAKQLGARIFYIEKPSIKTAFSYYKNVKNLFKEYGSEWSAVHIHEVLVQTVVNPLAKKYGISKRILHSHIGNDNKPLLKKIRDKILFIGYKKNTTHYFACSKYAGYDMFGKNIKNNFYIIKNAIDSKKYIRDSIKGEKIREEFNIPKDSIVYGTIGRITEQKNPEFTINLFEKINNKKDSYLLLVGDGDLKDNIKNLAIEKQIIDRVIFTGNRADVECMLQAMDVFLFPSLYEGLGIALIEAQAAGLYCLASNNVPIEAKVTDRVKFLPLDLDLWLDNALNIKESDIKKVDTTKDIENNFYDINSNVQLLQDIYLSQEVQNK